MGLIEVECRPHGVVGRGRSLDVDAFARHRVVKSHAPGVQVDGTVFVAAPCAIFHIAFHRAANRGQLGADWVMPTLDQHEMQEVITIAAAQQAIAKLGSFTAGFVVGIGSREVLAAFLRIKWTSVPSCSGGGFCTTARYSFSTVLACNCAFRLVAAVLVLAKTVTPLTGRSRRCTTNKG